MGVTSCSCWSTSLALMFTLPPHPLQAGGVVLVQEWADGGDLLQLLINSGTQLSEQSAAQLVVTPLLKAVFYLHSKSIIHRWGRRGGGVEMCGCSNLASPSSTGGAACGMEQGVC